MKSKQYAKIEGIPSGNASRRLTEGCLVLEGGALRGTYGVGVMDALMLADINFSCVIGTSAGVLNAVSYVSGQIGRSVRIPLRYRHDPRYFGMRAMLRNKSPFGFDFMFGEIAGRLDPLDWERFNEPERRLVAVVTNCRTGGTEYLEKGKCPDICQAMRASSTMPYVSSSVFIGGQPYLDGGCSCKIPYRWALEEGFRHIVVVRTNPRGYRRVPGRGKMIARLAYGRRWPKLAESLGRSNDDYNAQCEELDFLEKEGRIFVFAPSRSLGVKRMEPDLDKLGAWYEMGLHESEAAMPGLMEYLGR